MSVLPIYHREKGEGRPLILIHGFCETGGIWNRIENRLATKWKVILPDLPGFGRSPLPPTPFTLDDIGLRMLDWMGPWQEDFPVVIGHSLGGYVTLAMANQKPACFGGFGLFHSTASEDSPEKKENRNKVIDFVGRRGVPPFVETFVPSLFFQKENPCIPEMHDMASQTAPSTLLAYSAAMRDRHSREKLLGTFPRPILFIAGEMDALIPIQQVLEQSKLVRFPVFHSLANTGHVGMLEKPAESSEIVEDFMNFTLDFTPDKNQFQ